MITNSSNGYDGSLLNGLQSLPQWREYYNTPSGATLGALSNAYTLGNFAALPVCAWFNGTSIPVTCRPVHAEGFIHVLSLAKSCSPRTQMPEC